MATKKKAQVAYNLVIDEETDRVIGFMAQAAMKDPMFMMGMVKNGLHNALLAFLDDSSEKNHALGWCKDPECSYQKK